MLSEQCLVPPLAGAHEEVGVAPAEDDADSCAARYIVNIVLL